LVRILWLITIIHNLCQFFAADRNVLSATAKSHNIVINNSILNDFPAGSTGCLPVRMSAVGGKIRP
jgi:hypothetical protein